MTMLVFFVWLDGGTVTHPMQMPTAEALSLRAADEVIFVHQGQTKIGTIEIVTKRLRADTSMFDEGSKIVEINFKLVRVRPLRADRP